MLSWQDGLNALVVEGIEAIVFRTVNDHIELAPDAFTEIRYAGNQLRHTLTVLIAAAYWDRRRCGFEDPPWTLIGMYTRGRLLAPPRSG